MAHAVGEGMAVEERRGQHMHRVEPAAGLGQVFHDEIGGKVLLKPLAVLKGIVGLGEGHGARVEPDIQHFRHAPHGAFAAGIVGVGAQELINVGPVQIAGTPPEVALNLVQPAIHIHARVLRVVALPDGNRRSPEAVAADGPIARGFEPLAEKPVPHMARNPVDSAVQLDHAILEAADLQIPGIHGAVDQRLVGAPAVRVVVLDGLVPQQRAPLAQIPDDLRVGVEDEHSRVIRNLRREAPGLIHRHRGGQPRCAANLHVFFAEARRHVHDAGSLFHIHKIGGEHAKSARPAFGGLGQLCKEGKQRAVAPPHQRAALHAAHLPRRAELGGKLLHAGRAQNHAPLPVFPVEFQQRVIELRPHRHGEIRGQRPGRRGPGQQFRGQRVAALGGLRQQLEANGDRRILPRAQRIIEARLEVRERSLRRP